MSDALNSLVDRSQDLVGSAVSIWLSGGWAMIAIAFIGVVMFSVGFNVYISLQAKRADAVPERVWRRWISHPLERRGKIGELVDGAAATSTLEEESNYFDELRKTETVPFERNLQVMKTCVGATPLVGLLGTVTGMLSTFGALATGGGGEKTMSMVASGISEALITTETGLVIALPGLFFQYILTRKHERYRVFLAHLESVCSQVLYRKIQIDDQRRIAGEARTQVIRRLLAARDSTAQRTLSAPANESRVAPSLHPQP